MNAYSWCAIFAALAILTACPGSPGQIVNERVADLSFVTADDFIYIDTATGLKHVRVDGGASSQVFSGNYTVQAISRDHSIWALSDSTTSLFLMYGSGGPIQRIPELDGRASGVTISPDGKLVAVTRHADFSLPQSQWVEDDRLYIIDVETRAVTILNLEKVEWLMRLFWSKDGSKIYADSHATPYEIDPTSGKRKAISEIPRDDIYPMFSSPVECGKDARRLVINGDLGINIAKNGVQEPLVTIEGKSREFHDYQDIIPRYFFTKSCEFVVFEFNSQVWVTEVKTGLTSALLRGHNPRTLPGNSVEE